MVMLCAFTENQALKAEVKALKAENKTLKAELKTINLECAKLKFKYEQLLKLVFGSKLERFVNADTNTEQLNLFATDNIEQQEKQADTETVRYERKKKTKKRKDHPGRYPFPDHLEVVEQIIEPDIDTSQMTKVGQEVSEHLDYTAASLIRVRVIRNKYLHKTSKQFHIAKPPARALP